MLDNFTIKQSRSRRPPKPIAYQGTSDGGAQRALHLVTSHVYTTALRLEHTTPSQEEAWITCVSHKCRAWRDRSQLPGIIALYTVPSMKFTTEQFCLRSMITKFHAQCVLFKVQPQL
ncbi:hypothetical protein DPMN_096620 [Dreissena polymorpha]|uniref:Uncharacterized protein n=1 Tax=Dreissena polymorpha TaxID=45954 RepID=A0A9D4LBP7_DREPO|nr:hypothetical protein DPMN_096620 [Dreissena polymorpha]